MAEDPRKSRLLPTRSRMKQYGRIRVTWSYGYPGRKGIGLGLSLVPRRPAWEYHARVMVDPQLMVKIIGTTDYA